VSENARRIFPKKLFLSLPPPSSLPFLGISISSQQRLLNDDDFCSKQHAPNTYGCIAVVAASKCILSRLPSYIGRNTTYQMNRSKAVGGAIQRLRRGCE
jgi:hypothetical protein